MQLRLSFVLLGLAVATYARPINYALQARSEVTPSTPYRTPTVHADSAWKARVLRRPFSRLAPMFLARLLRGPVWVASLQQPQSTQAAQGCLLSGASRAIRNPRRRRRGFSAS
ncbi:hypothetical protein EV361DRAFT_589098 [Lentinula raphanica]|nr:hypothetical protein EV361DRAFT_589098 [Lentinula raphanica]